MAAQIEGENVYEDFSKDGHLFHFNNYTKASSYYNNSNILVVRNMKDVPCL